MDEPDADAIRQLLHAYGDAVLAVDDVAWGRLWTDDGRWMLAPDRVLQGRDAIVSHWRDAMGAYRRVVQLYLSSTATIDGDTAAGRAYLVELNVTAAGDRLVLAGWYDDAYRRTPEGWRFAARSLTKLYRGPSDLSGTFFGLDEPS